MTAKRGSPYLRETLFNIMEVYIQTAPADEPIFQFLDRKRAEGKPYYVYMTAGANKFLRRYYAQVNDYLKTLEPSLLWKPIRNLCQHLDTGAAVPPLGYTHQHRRDGLSRTP